MKIIMLSRGRHDYSPSISTMPPALREIVEVWVPKAEYKTYKESPLFSGVKIEAWPSYIDCVPKKRRFLYENIDSEYMSMDDDLSLKVWSATENKFVKAVDKPKLFMRHLENIYDSLDSHTVVGAANTFMTSLKIKETGSTVNDDVPFCFVGFAADRPKLTFKTFFFTDIAMPMQIVKAGMSVRTNASIAYDLKSNEKLKSTGTTPYRTDAVILYSAVTLAQQCRGHVFGLSKTANHGGDWSLKKSFRKPSKERSEKWLSEFAAEHGLKALPIPVELSLKTSMEELHELYRKSWSDAIGGRGNPVGLKTSSRSIF
jgi:hypothetical protein